MTHILACASFCNSDGTLNSGGAIVAWLLGGVFGLAAVIAVIRGILGGLGVKAVKNNPVTPPWARELATGYRVAAYRSRVRARTPDGTVVTMHECCRAGHQVPAQATAHAALIADRIAVRGR